MTVCPVCEHQQVQGNECDVCGKLLGRAAEIAAPITALAELEQTSFAAAPAPAVAALPELEPSRYAAGPDLPAVRLVDVELTSVAPVGAVAVEFLSDLDSGRYVDTGPRTRLPVARVCRYCQNTQAEGAVCARCGMQLPKIALEPAAVARVAPADGPVIKCPQCGSRVHPGEICGGCGIQY